MTEKLTGPSHLKLSLILSNIVTFEHSKHFSYDDDGGGDGDDDYDDNDDDDDDYRNFKI